MKTHLRQMLSTRAVAILTRDTRCCSTRYAWVSNCSLRAGDAIAISSQWTNQSRQYVGKLPAADCLGHERAAMLKWAAELRACARMAEARQCLSVLGSYQMQSCSCSTVPSLRPDGAV
jgi:formate-dependent nitrite reductase cytochrome c552 subunit